MGFSTQRAFIVLLFCIAQLIGMSHSAPEATFKPKHFEFTPCQVTHPSLQ